MVEVWRVDSENYHGKAGYSADYVVEAMSRLDSYGFEPVISYKGITDPVEARIAAQADIDARTASPKDALKLLYSGRALLIHIVEEEHRQGAADYAERLVRDGGAIGLEIIPSVAQALEDFADQQQAWMKNPSEDTSAAVQKETVVAPRHIFIGNGLVRFTYDPDTNYESLSP